jgi:hypothetical protein
VARAHSLSLEVFHGTPSEFIQRHLASPSHSC